MGPHVCPILRGVAVARQETRQAKVLTVLGAMAFLPAPPFFLLPRYDGSVEAKLEFAPNGTLVKSGMTIERELTTADSPTGEDIWGAGAG